MLAIIAGFGAASLLTSASRRRIAASLGVLLLAWQVVSSAAAHPDYLSYFNEIGAREPERIIVDNDLDWGQDLNRLSEKLRELGTKEVALSYFGTADIARHGLPAVRPLVPYQPTTGWVAISLYNLKLRGLSLKEKMGKPDSPWAWLQVYKPVATVGKSIRLYYVPPQSSAAPIR
jgi:hypothetical protein